MSPVRPTTDPLSNPSSDLGRDLSGFSPPVSLPAAKLRSWELRDAQSLVRAWSDPSISRWNPAPPDPSLEYAQHWIGGTHQRLVSGISVDLCIVERSNPATVLGEVGLSGFSTRHQGAFVGYWLFAESRGNGHATAAVDAICSWAFGELDLAMIAARCDPENSASHAVVGRANFAARGQDNDGCVVWVRTAEPNALQSPDEEQGPSCLTDPRRPHSGQGCN